MSNDVQQRPAAWEGFVGGNWETNVDVRDFIQKNYTPYEGDASFLAPATEATTKLWAEVMEGIKVENRTHEPYKIDAQIVSGITSHAPGYIDKDLETIVGLQTDEPLKRSIMPFGGLKMVQDACKVYNVELNPEVSENFHRNIAKPTTKAYLTFIRPTSAAAVKSGVITGLPDAYGRGRIIGDYRRVALYGIDFLMKDKLNQFKLTASRFWKNGVDLEEVIRRREESTNNTKPWVK